MSELLPSWPVEAARLLGDPHPLVGQLSSPSVLTALARADANLPPAVRDLASLRGFLTWYRMEILIPLELPAIRKAFEHANRFEVRELLAVDAALVREPRLRHFGAASRAVGRSQLWRLLPLRDQRLVRRYWQAAEDGKARAWHVLIYGVVLSVFSLPLRQGLMSYGRQTLAGFVDAASRGQRWPVAECARLFWEEAGRLPSAIEMALGPGRPRLALCEHMPDPAPSRVN